jgi:hypothetical protein
MLNSDDDESAGAGLPPTQEKTTSVPNVSIPRHPLPAKTNVKAEKRGVGFPGNGSHESRVQEDLLRL